MYAALNFSAGLGTEIIKQNSVKLECVFVAVCFLCLCVLECRVCVCRIVCLCLCICVRVIYVQLCKVSVCLLSVEQFTITEALPTQCA